MFNLQLFAVYPVHTNVFKIGTAGRGSSAGQMAIVKDMETFSPGFDNNIEEWTPMDQEGWIRRALTGKGLTIALSGKRSTGDAGNDYVAQNIIGTGSSVESKFEWTMPDGSVLSGDCIVNTTTPGGGDSTNIDSLEFEILSDGKPSFTAANQKLTFVTLDGSIAGKTKITTVSPTLGGGNSYRVALNVGVPAIGFVASSWGATYTLAADLTAVENDTVVLVEVVTATGVVVKAGWAHANVQ